MQYPQLKYVPERQDPSLTIETAELVAKVIDNTGLLGPAPEAASYFQPSGVFTPFTHHLGYHGIRTLYHKAEKRNLVVPMVSWLNLQTARLEGLPADPIDERAAFGMGRGWPVRMEKDGGGALLHLDPLPSMQMRYSLRLQPAEPDGIDFSVRFELTRRPDSGPTALKASWPCYVSGYDDVRLFYPKGDEASWRWAALGQPPNIVLGEPVNYKHRQEAFHADRQALPLAYGRIGQRCLILMFSDPGVRLYVVNAGGHLFCSPVQNPAWDFAWTAEGYPLDQPIGFDGRLVYTRFEGPDAVLERYRAWVGARSQADRGQ